MPRRVTDKERLLAYAFTADVPALEDAIAVLSAALKAKKGGGAPRTRKPAQRPASAAAKTPAVGQDKE